MDTIESFTMNAEPEVRVTSSSQRAFSALEIRVPITKVRISSNSQRANSEIKSEPQTKKEK